MKRIIFSDLHLHNWNFGATVTPEGFNSRLWNQWLSAKEMINYAEEYNVKYVYFCGDLFHIHGFVSTPALFIATKIFTELRKRGIKLRVVPGNHDMADKQGNIHGLCIASEEEISGKWMDDGLNVYALPYTQSEEALKQFLGNVGDGDGGMVLLHQGVAGVPLSSGYLLDEKLNPKMIPDNSVAFTGHYHFHKKVTPRLTVVGNLTPLNWGDIDQGKGWLCWDDETGKCEQILQRSSPMFISWNKKREKHSDLLNVNGAFVRYTDPVTTTQMDKERNRLQEAGALTVQFSNFKTSNKETKIRSGDQITMDHLLEQFYKNTEGRRREVGIEVRENRYAFL